MLNKYKEAEKDNQFKNISFHYANPQRDLNSMPREMKKSLDENDLKIYKGDSLTVPEKGRLSGGNRRKSMSSGVKLDKQQPSKTGPKLILSQVESFAAKNAPDDDSDEDLSIGSDSKSSRRSNLDDFIENILSEGALEIEDEERRDNTLALGIPESEVRKRTSKPPFHKVIEHLTKLSGRKKPIEKMRVIA